MKATGIIRRIDSLGRVVVPKEMRKALRIIENDMLEISIRDDLIVLKKVSSFSDSVEDFDGLLKLVNKLYEFDIFVTDSSEIVSYCGKNKDRYIGKNISEDLLKCLQNRKIIEETANSTLQITEEQSKNTLNINYILIPIVSSGDVYGILGILGFKEINETRKIGKIIAKILEYKTNEIWRDYL